MIFINGSPPPRSSLMRTITKPLGSKRSLSRLFFPVFIFIAYLQKFIEVLLIGISHKKELKKQNNCWQKTKPLMMYVVKLVLKVSGHSAPCLKKRSVLRRPFIAILPG